VKPISGATRVVALLGHPVRHSRSPALHNGWFAAQGINAVYVALDAPPDTDAAAVVRAGLWGANLTIPLKRTVIDRVDRLEADAEAAGAVNTLYWSGDQLVGANTDIGGWEADALRHGPLTGRHAVILGGGGAAMAVALALGRQRAASVHVANRSACDELVQRLAAAAPGLRVTQGPLTDDALTGADLVVNALPGAARGAVEALSHDGMAAEGTWFDLNYWDDSPPGMAQAAARGWATVDGHGMLREQAALAYERWVGQPPP